MKVTSLMLYAINVEATTGFYRALGVDFDEQPGRSVGGTTMPGFEIEFLEDSVERLRGTGRRNPREPETLSWGRRAVVSDPDGRAVELIERP